MMFVPVTLNSAASLAHFLSALSELGAADAVQREVDGIVGRRDDISHLREQVDLGV